MGESFVNEACKSYTEVDITPIVQSWQTGKVENKGLMMMGNCGAEVISYASATYPIVGMRSMLRLIYDEPCPCQTLVETPCIVEVR